MRDQPLPPSPSPWSCRSDEAIALSFGSHGVFAVWNWLLGREGRTYGSTDFLVETSQLDGTVCIQDIHQGSVRDPPPHTLVNSKSGPTVVDRPKNGLRVSLRSCVNEVTLEYILCGCLYFVNSMTDIACLIFQKMCVLGANNIMKWYLIKTNPCYTCLVRVSCLANAF